MLGWSRGSHHPPSVPVCTAPGQLRATEHLALLIGEEGAVARRFDLLPDAVREAAWLQDDVAELARRQEPGQRVEPEQAAADRLMTDLRVEADERLVDAVEDAQRRGDPLLERP